MKIVEKIALTKHLAVMVKSGISLSEAMANLADSASGSKNKEMLRQIREELENGKELNKALEKHGRVFDNFYRGIIRVGEKTGKLDSSLEYLALELNQEYSLSRKISGALMYPMVIMVATIGLGGFISLYILPKLVDFFKAFDAKLPMATKILLAVAEFMKSYGLWLLVSLVLVLVLGRVLLINSKIKYVWQQWQLRWPIVGRLLRDREVTRFCRNMGILIKSGVPIFESFEVAANSQTNLVYQRAIGEMGKNLEKGKGMAEALNKGGNMFLFPRLVADMVAVGEKSGKLDESLLYVSQFFEEEIEDRAKNMASIIEPVVLLLIGLLVAFVALAIISPIYELTGAIGG